MSRFSGRAPRSGDIDSVVASSHEATPARVERLHLRRAERRTRRWRAGDAAARLPGDVPRVASPDPCARRGRLPRARARPAWLLAWRSTARGRRLPLAPPGSRRARAGRRARRRPLPPRRPRLGWRCRLADRWPSRGPVGVSSGPVDAPPDCHRIRGAGGPRRPAGPVELHAHIPSRGQRRQVPR